MSRLSTDKGKISRPVNSIGRCILLAKLHEHYPRIKGLDSAILIPYAYVLSLCVLFHVESQSHQHFGACELRCKKDFLNLTVAPDEEPSRIIHLVRLRLVILDPRPAIGSTSCSSTVVNKSA